MNKFRSAILGSKSGEDAKPLMATKKAGPHSDGLGSIGIPRDSARTADHREEDRHRLSQETASIRFKGKDHVVDLINLSGGGAMIAADINPRLWDRVDLFLGEGNALECAVRWKRADRIGLEFAHETQIDCAGTERDALLLDVIHRSFPEVALTRPAPAKAEPITPLETRRNNHRHPLIWNGAVLWQHDSYPVRLRNISTTGALVDLDANVPPGSDIMLDLGESGQLFASVSWIRGGQAGLNFAHLFDLSALAAARPEVAEHNWQRPSFLDQASNQSSPWATEWERRSLEDLRADLEGFMKH